jgi:NADP-dependent 3-hydroxy acid dehydrogenase YdfG
VRSLQGAVVAVTGASSGIGRECALAFAREGSRVALCARRLDRLEEVAEAVRAMGGEAWVTAADVADPEQVRRFVLGAVSRFGRLDVLVNNAGIGPISPLDDLRVEEWEQMLDVNVRGVLYGIAAALPVFREQGSGQFVNTASTAAHRIVPSMAVYAATKTAVRVISEGLRQEAGDRLRVTVVTPGVTRTDFADDISDPDIKAQIAASKALGMPPDAIARAIAFAIEQPDGVDVGEIIVRPTAQA